MNDFHSLHDIRMIGKTDEYVDRKEHSELNKKKEPHEQMTEKNNHLSSAQEVTYQNDFNKADKASKDEENWMDRNSTKKDIEH